MKKIIVLGAGFYYKKTIQELVNSGFYIIALDKNKDAEGKDCAHEFYPIDIVNQNEVLELAKVKSVDGIMNLNEFGSRTASYVANTLGLVGHSYETVEATNDKGIMRDKWFANDLSIPRYIVFSEYSEAIKCIGTIGFPCVLKPADSGGSGRGISILKSLSDLEWAYKFASQYARNGRFIIEEFIDGVELTVETFTCQSRHVILAISDKIKPDIRTRVATSLNYPAKLDYDTKIKVTSLVRDALTSLGITGGIAHTEVIVNNLGVPYLVETGARGGGGHIFHTIIEIVSGIKAPLLQAKWLTSSNINIDDVKENGCCYRFFNPEHGILKGVENVNVASQIDGVVDMGIIKKIGDEVGNLENSLHRAGFVVTRGETREDAIFIADEVEKTISFIIEPIQC